jgi:putative transposase
MKLNLRRKYIKGLPANIKEPLLQPLHHNLTWSMDFIHDGLLHGKVFRAFNVIDDFNCEALTIPLTRASPSKRVIRELDKWMEWRGTLPVIRKEP